MVEIVPVKEVSGVQNGLLPFSGKSIVACASGVMEVEMSAGVVESARMVSAVFAGRGLP